MKIFLPYLLVLCIMMLFLSGCENKNETIISSSSDVSQDQSNSTVSGISTVSQSEMTSVQSVVSSAEDQTSSGNAVEIPVTKPAATQAQHLSLIPDKLLDYTKYNVEAYTAPYNTGTVVYNESALIIKNEDGTYPDISLLYPINDIISVRSSSLETEYKNGKDFLIVDGKLRVLTGSKMPAYSHNSIYLKNKIAGKSYPNADGGYLFCIEGKTFHTMQIAVTYTHKKVTYDGFIQPYKGDLLPKTIAKMNQKSEIKISFIGDSITYGLNTTGAINTAPFAPSWPALTVEALNKIYKQKVKFENFGICGTKASWGLEQMNKSIIPSKPDLFVIAFGMNDGAGLCSANEFVGNIKNMIDKMHAAYPNCEILVISTTLPNPKIPEANGTQTTFEQALLKLETKGVAIIQMTSVHKSLLKYKKFTDLTGSNLNHPNDFLSRVYAQSILSALIKTPVTATPIGTENQKTNTLITQVELPTFNIDESKVPVLKVMVNEKYCLKQNLTEYLGNGNAWVSIPVDKIYLKQGVNQFALDSNIMNKGNLVNNSIDLYSTSDKTGIMDSFVTTDNSNNWALMTNRYLNIKLEIYNGKEWISYPNGESYRTDGGSLVVGKFVPNNTVYGSDRNIYLNNLTGISKARLLVNLHVGNDLQLK